jgi:CBS-domain-containing membrane protein
MSPRAACRLATLGYDAYDYAAGKVDWMAHGLPIEGAGASRTTALTLLRHDVVTCGLDDLAEDLARELDASPYGFALALSPGRVVLGRVRRSRLAAAGASVAALLEPGPSTIRPHTSSEDLAARWARSDVRTMIVTDPDGKLLGILRRGDVEELSPMRR